MDNLPMITRRKVHSTKTAYTISLPKQWFDDNNIEVGPDTRLVVVAHRHILILNPSEADKVVGRKEKVDDISFQDIVEIVRGGA